MFKNPLIPLSSKKRMITTCSELGAKCAESKIPNFRTPVFEPYEQHYYLYLSFLLKEYMILYLNKIYKHDTCLRVMWLLLCFTGVFHLEMQGQTEYKKFLYENGQVSSEGTMESGKPNGYWITYFEDGTKKSEGNRKNFQLDSTWKFYRADGVLERVITYREDLKNGLESVYDEKGRRVVQYNNENNIKQDEARYFYETGELWKSIQFANNIEEGKAIEYAKDGRVITYMTYRNGFLYSQEPVNRYNSEGNRTGVWKDNYANTSLLFEEGNWSNGKKNGVFKIFNKKGNLEKMEKYVNGVLIEGDAETALMDIRKEYYPDGTLRMIGGYRDNAKHGSFREFDKDGNVINSYVYEAGQVTGEGMLDSTGMRNGPWKLFYPDGKLRAEGAYKNGKRQGPWTYYYQSGKVEQRGNYNEDLSGGEWKWYYQSGSMHREETYRKGREDGHSVEYDSLGVAINEGDYIDGRKHGMWTQLINDHYESGEYADGERIGLWIWKFDNGQKAFEGEFLGGVPVGKHRYWYSNGATRMKGEYQGGEMEGVWYYYDESAVLLLEMEYVAGEAVGINGRKIKLPKNRDDQE
jgi:antitoxin component YwqK of YwqJK toxin-antitoxin module